MSSRDSRKNFSHATQPSFDGAAVKLLFPDQTKLHIERVMATGHQLSSELERAGGTGRVPFHFHVSYFSVGRA